MLPCRLFGVVVCSFRARIYAWSSRKMLVRIRMHVDTTHTRQSQSQMENSSRLPQISSARRPPSPPCRTYLTPIACLGPRLLELLCALGSESSGAERLLSPLPALALAEPVRLRTCGPPFLMAWGG